MAAAGTNHGTVSSPFLRSDSEISSLTSYAIDPVVRADAASRLDTALSKMALDKDVGAITAPCESVFPNSNIGSSRKQAEGKREFHAPSGAPSDINVKRHLPPLRMHASLMSSRTDDSTDGFSNDDNDQYDGTTHVKRPILEQCSLEYRQNRMAGVSGPSTSSTTDTNRSVPRSAADLAYILNDDPKSPFVGQKRNLPEMGSSPLKKRRGSHSDPPVPADARTITCAFPKCGAVLANERSAVASHINSTHAGEGSTNKTKVWCQWLNVWGEECRTLVASNGLFRHVLDRHTSLLLTVCPACGKSFRKDSLGRHTGKCRGPFPGDTRENP